MAKRRKLTDKNGAQIYPITHTKAVYDDNGRTVETRFGLLDNLKANKANTYTKSEVNNLVLSAGSGVIYVAELPESGVANKVYRVPGVDSYSDWGWDDTEQEFVLLAEYTGDVFVQITEAAYDALSDEEKNNGVWYFIEEE